MNDGALFGIWDAVRYGPGSMSDETLVLQADGRGFWRFDNAGEAYVEAFEWTMGAEGALRIAGTASYLMEYLEGGRVTEEPGRLTIEGLRFRIAWKEASGGGQMEVLTLDEGGERWRGVLREAFGVVSSDFKRRQAKTRGPQTAGLLVR